MNLRVAFVLNFDERAWAGGRNYLATLFMAIHAAAGDAIDIVLITGTRTSTTLQDDVPFIKLVRTPLLDRWSFAWIARKSINLLAPEGDVAFARLLSRLRVDVFSHGWGLGSSSVKTLGWLPDFQFLHYPHYWSPGQLSVMKRMYLSTCLRCNALLVSSHDALNDLKSFSPSCRTPSHVLHFVSAPIRSDLTEDKVQLLARYGLPDSYFYLPNQFWAHKNHRLVIDALAILKKQHASATVVCTGNTADFRNPQHFTNLMAYANALGVNSNFRVLGMVPLADVQSLMHHARAVINPSRFEGWSSSVEEAKTLGKHVLLSNIAVHREQAPAECAYFEVEDARRLAELMQSSIESSPAPVDLAVLRRKYAGTLLHFGQEYIEILKRL